MKEKRGCAFYFKETFRFVEIFHFVELQSAYYLYDQSDLENF